MISTDHRSDRSVILWALDKQDPFELDANLQEASEQALFLGNEVAPHEWLHA